MEYAAHIELTAGSCPHCGGEMDWKASVGSLEEVPETHFFECRGCGHIHTLEKESERNVF
jgi:hypothetical protein